MRRALHQCQEIDALDPSSSLDRRNEPMEGRTELGKLGRSHLTEIQKMPPGLDDVAPWTGDIQKLRPRFQAVLLPADIAVRPVIIRRRTDFYRTLTGRFSPEEIDTHTLHLSVGTTEL
jgi:hypothetical protein